MDLPHREINVTNHVIGTAVVSNHGIRDVIRDVITSVTTNHVSMTAVDTVIVTASMTTVVDHHTSQVDMVMVRGDEVRHPHRDFSKP